MFLLIQINLLETIRVGLLNIDKVPAESLVTELSSVEPMSESEIERNAIEIEMITKPTPKN
jgi:hypothetical protein